MIPVNEPLLTGNEKKYLAECIDTGWISSEGPFIAKLEAGICELTKRKYGIAVSNGSVAIDAVIQGLGIGRGDEVIMPAFTIISCIAPIVRSGAMPVLIDVDEVTWNMKVEDIEAKITSRTKAIMAVHIYGLPVDMDPILHLAEKYNLKVIEDAAEVIGQTYKGRPCGNMGTVSTFSFYPNKHITTGEGGMILTDDAELAERCRQIRNLCFIPPRRFIHNELGWNFRMTNLQAAIGVAQLEQLPFFLEKKKTAGAWYNELLPESNKYLKPLKQTSYAENIYWVYGLLISKEVNANAQLVMKMLADEGVMTRPFFYSMHLQPVFQKDGFFKGEDYPGATYLGEKGFYLPSGLGLTREQAIKVAAKVEKVFSEL